MTSYAKIAALGEAKSLRVADYYERRWSKILGRPVLAPLHRGRIGWVATIMSLWVLNAALVRINSFSSYSPDQYVVTAAVGCDAGRCDRGPRSDEYPRGLSQTMRFYWYTAHVCIISGLILDVLRCLKISSAVADALLCFESAARERRRKFAFLTLAVPFLHLAYWFSQPVVFAGCCVAAPSPDALRERISSLAFLLFISGFILLGKCHEHGYFFFRVPPQDSCASYLLREHLICTEDARAGGKPKARRASLILMALGQGGGTEDDEVAKDERITSRTQSI